MIDPKPESALMMNEDRNVNVDCRGLTGAARGFRSLCAWSWEYLVHASGIFYRLSKYPTESSIQCCLASERRSAERMWEKDA